MTVKEYLHQAYRLDQRIKSDTMEAQNMIKTAYRLPKLRKHHLSGRLRSCGHWKRKSPMSWKSYQTLRNRYERSLRQFLIPTSAWF